MLDDCPHMIQAVNASKLRKMFGSNKHSAKPTCVRCKFQAFDKFQEYWICLHCGKIGCGDLDAQQGDAAAHYENSADSMDHAIVLHIDRDRKCWCYACKSEINNRNGHLTEAIANVKLDISFPERTKPSSVAIPLPPPQPRIPAIAEIEPSSNSVPMQNTHNKYKGSNNNRQPAKQEVTNYSHQISDKPGGLTNLGNTCFMNSTLQCLASTRLLIPKLEIFGRGEPISMVVTQSQDEAVIEVVSPAEKDMAEDSSEDVGVNNLGGGDGLQPNSDSSDLSKPLQITLDIGSETMTGRLRQTIRGTRKFETSKYRDADVNEASCSNNRNSSAWYNAYRPGEVHELVSKNFRRGAQHDAHELLRTIIDMMKKDQTKAFRQGIMKHYGVKKGGEGSDPTLIEMVKSLDEKVKHKTFVDEVFGGELMTTQTCLTCKHVKSSHEQFLDLSLPLRVIKHSETEKKPARKSYFTDDRTTMTIMKSLQECLVHFTEAELLTGSNVVECANCHRINLEKIESGISPEEVFPSLASTTTTSSEKSSSQSSPDSERKTFKDKKQEERERKKRNRSNKKKARNVIPKETVEEDMGEKEIKTEPSSPSEMSLVENHFHSEESEKEGHVSMDGGKRSDGDSSTQTLENYVVIDQPIGCPTTQTMDRNPDNRLLAENLAENCVKEETEFMDADFEDLPPLLDELPYNNFASTKRISESLQNLTLNKMERDLDDVGGDIEDDFDLPPAMDGVVGSASDEEEGGGAHGMPDLDFGLPSFDKFRNFQLQTIEDDQNEVAVKEPLVEKPITADEGFSEGENSMSVDNDAARRVSQGPSASSSRNSLSDSDETSKSSSNGEVGDATVAETSSLKIPKVTKCPCSRQQRISRPPEILTIHFKRFQMSMGGYATKIGDHVKYPIILDLTPFCSREREAEGIFDEDGQVIYSLYGIVEHSGTMNWGHYVAYVKSSENDKRWFHISDSSVSITALNRVADEEAYILFYERIRGDEKKRKLSIRLAEPTPISEPTRENEAPESWKSAGASNTCHSPASWNDYNALGQIPVAMEPWVAEEGGFQMVEPTSATVVVNHQPTESTDNSCQIPSITVDSADPEPSAEAEEEPWQLMSMDITTWVPTPSAPVYEPWNGVTTTEAPSEAAGDSNTWAPENGSTNTIFHSNSSEMPVLSQELLDNYIGGDSGIDDRIEARKRQCYPTHEGDGEASNSTISNYLEYQKQHFAQIQVVASGNEMEDEQDDGHEPIRNGTYQPEYHGELGGYEL